MAATPNLFKVIDRIKDEWSEYPIKRVSFHKKFAPPGPRAPLVIDGVEILYQEEDSLYGNSEVVRIFLPNFDVTRHILNEEWSYHQ